MEQKQMIMFALVAIGAFLLAAPPQYQTMIKVDTPTKQIIACVAFLAAYYIYNDEKLF